MFFHVMRRQTTPKSKFSRREREETTAEWGYSEFDSSEGVISVFYVAGAVAVVISETHYC